MISDFWFAISAQRRKMQKRRYFWFSFVKWEWKLQLWFSTAYRVYFLFFNYVLDFAKWKSENWTWFLISDFKLKMKIRKLNLNSDFWFQIENEKWKSLSDFRFPFSNRKRKSELWNSTRTILTNVYIKQSLAASDIRYTLPFPKFSYGQMLPGIGKSQGHLPRLSLTAIYLHFQCFLLRWT